eukprot:jgi/Tetstr1/423514/TSEL_014190.t1
MSAAFGPVVRLRLGTVDTRASIARSALPSRRSPPRRPRQRAVPATLRRPPASGVGRPAAALPGAQEVAAVAAVAATDGAAGSVGLLVAKVSGTAISAGAILLFSPIIVNLLRSKDGEGISCTTFWMQLIGFTAIFIYNHTKGFPIAAYGENVSLAAQSLVILLLATYYQGRLDARFLGLMGLFCAWVGASLSGMMAPAVLSGMQIAATCVLTGAIIPQILLNFKQQGTGEWSLITAVLSTAGNGLRVFTTLQLTRDPILLAGYILGFLVNATLLGQIVYYNHIAPARGTGSGDSGERRPAR